MNDEQRKIAYLEMVLSWYEEREAALVREEYFLKRHIFMPMPVQIEGVCVCQGRDGTTIITCSPERMNELKDDHDKEPFPLFCDNPYYAIDPQSGETYWIAK